MRPPRATREKPAATPRTSPRLASWYLSMDRGERHVRSFRASNLGDSKTREGRGREGKKRERKGECPTVGLSEGGRRGRGVAEGRWKNASLRINGGVATTMHSPDIQASGQLVRYSTDRISGQIIRFSFFVASCPFLPLFFPLFRLDLFPFTFSPSLYIHFISLSLCASRSDASTYQRRDNRERWT